MVEPMNMSTILYMTLGSLVSINGTVLPQNGSLISIQWYLLMNKMFHESIGENLLYANSQNSTQPDIHVDVVLPYISTIVSFAST